MSPDELSGRTIARTESRSAEYHGVRLHFTDGTYADIEGTGYDDSCVTVEHVTAEQHARRVEEDRVSQEERVSRSYCPARYPPRLMAASGAMLKDLYAGPIMDELNRQTYSWELAGLRNIAMYQADEARRRIERLS